VEAYIPEVDEALAQLVPNSALVVILGHQGSGKTAQAMRLLEQLKDLGPPYIVGLPLGAAALLPKEYGLADDFDAIPNGAVIYVPEAYRYFPGRLDHQAR